MTQLTFVTLFLGLVFGPQDVRMNVTGPAPAHVELRVDGRIVATMDKAPWTAHIDFGARLRPHELTARALDENGKELARVLQKINLPERLSETQIILERSDKGVPTGVQMLWHSLEADKPKHAEISLDGKQLTLDSHLHAALPTIDMQLPHVIRGRALAPSGLPSSTELAFGGGIEDQAGAHLTAIGVRLHNNANPTVADYERILKLNSGAVHVAAVERLSPLIIVVRHPYKAEAEMRLDPFGGHFPRVTAPLHGEPPVAVFIWPVARKSQASSQADLFEWASARPFGNQDDFRLLIAHTTGPMKYDALQFTKAVAVAGLRAIDGRRPRAVVFVMSDATKDSSDFTAEQAREYLDSIGVPLYVWSLGELDDLGGWGTVSDIGSPVGFRKAFEEMMADVDSQRIVWIEGDHMPLDVRSTSANVETLARR